MADYSASTTASSESSAFYIHSDSESDYLADTNTKKKKLVSHSLIFSGRCAPLNILLKDIADYSHETRAPWMKPRKIKMKGGKSHWRFICQLGPRSRTPCADTPTTHCRIKNKRKRKKENLSRGSCRAHVSLVFRDDPTTDESPLAEVTTVELAHTCEPSAQKEAAIYDKSTVRKIPVKILQSAVGLVAVKASLQQYKAFIISNKLPLKQDTQSLQNFRSRVKKAIANNEVDELNYARYNYYTVRL